MKHGERLAAITITFLLFWVCESCECFGLSMEMQILIIPNISCAREWNEGRTEGRKEGRGREERHFRGRPDESLYRPGV